MSITIYNTLTKKYDEFVPVEDKKVKMYACGITVYDESHVGHASQAIIFDVIRSYLVYTGYDVTYIRNYTDIDDNIIKKANETGKTPKEISEYYIKESTDDLRKLKVRDATHQPKVTDHVTKIIDYIQVLIDKGFAYVSNNEVLFDTYKFTNYGKLSNRDVEDMEEQDDVVNKDNKRHHADFSLWKPAKPNEPFWESPWGKGRPGWHIECSVMARVYLGDTLDIHGGGLDLVFPHHENEIAQSEAYSGKKFANIWIHNGLVKVNNQKMSKSLKNFYTIKDILKLYLPDVIRFVVLSYHYSSHIDFSIDMFKNANKRVYYFYSTLMRIDRIIKTEEKSAANNLKEMVYEVVVDNYFKKTADDMLQGFVNSMNDNFNTAKVMGILSDSFKQCNDFIDKKSSSMSDKKSSLHYFIEKFKEIASVLNIFNENPEDFISSFKDLYCRQNNISIAEINSMIAQRVNAKKEKNYALADEIRNKLKNMHIILHDTVEGTGWSIEF